LVAIVGLLALGALFASLGAWQLRRAETSRETFARFAAGAAETPFGVLPNILDEAERFRQLEVHGEYVAEPQFLLDNMLNEGVAGYHVLTALRVAGLHQHVLVNRGWLPTGGDRRVLPNVAVDTAPRRVVGRIERLPRPGIRFAAAQSDGRATAVVVLQYPTADEIGHELGLPVFDYQLLLDPAEPDGYVREWRAPGLQPERHWSYAGQWFLLAIGSLGAALVMVWKTSRRKA